MALSAVMVEAPHVIPIADGCRRPRGGGHRSRSIVPTGRAIGIDCAAVMDTSITASGGGIETSGGGGGRQEVGRAEVGTLPVDGDETGHGEEHGGNGRGEDPRGDVGSGGGEATYSDALAATNSDGDVAARQTEACTAPVLPAHQDIPVDIAAASRACETLQRSSGAHTTDSPTTSAVEATAVLATLAQMCGGAPAKRRASTSLATPPPAKAHANARGTAVAPDSAAARIAGGGQRSRVRLRTTDDAADSRSSTEVRETLDVQLGSGGGGSGGATSPLQHCCKSWTATNAGRSRGGRCLRFFNRRRPAPTRTRQLERKTSAEN